MDTEWMDQLSGIYGVQCVILVDLDGLVVTQTGEVAEELAPHSALMVKQLLDRIGVTIMERWLWTQCETEKLIIGVANVEVGILVILMDPEANLGMVRLEARNIRRTLRRKFAQVGSTAAQGE